MGFAITFHKAQGRTILRLILALSKRPNGLKQISHSGLLVVLTRVQHRAHIRLLCKEGENLSYLTDLHCSELLLAWRAGFKDGKGKWNSQAAIEHYEKLQRKKKKKAKISRKRKGSRFFSSCLGPKKQKKTKTQEPAKSSSETHVESQVCCEEEST